MRPRGVAVAAVVALAAAACVGPRRAEPKTFTFAYCEPRDLIPQNLNDPCAGGILEALFTRLVDFDFKTHQPVNALAQSITSPDAQTWTIRIKDGYTFHNGEPVTAQSFVDAWNWGALQTNHAFNSVFFSPIQGYADLNPGEGKEPSARAMSGLQVIDRLTFRVILFAPFSQVPLVLGFDAFDPLPKAFFRDPKAFGEMPIGEGPYQMDGPWEHGKGINLKRYPGYAGTPGRSDVIRMPFASGYLSVVTGNADLIAIGPDEFDQARRELGDRFIQHPGPEFDFFRFPLYDPRFQSKDLRQAFALALDRDAIVIEVFKGAATPASSVISPVLPGHREDPCQYCHLDVTLAREKLAAAGGWYGKLILPAAEGGNLVNLAEAVAEQLRQNLGIDVEVLPMSAEDHLDSLMGHNEVGPGPSNWIMDYPSPQDYVEPLFGTNGSWNFSAYSNAEVDRLIAEANKATTVAESIELYQQAEDIVLEELPVIPLAYLGSNLGRSARVTNLEFTVQDYVRLELVEVTG